MRELHRFDDELTTAVGAAETAGREIIRLRAEGLRYGHKDGRELVSEADIRAAQMLHSAIIGAFPGDGWLSEEHRDTGERLGKDRVWIVDPIDGTREFLQGIPEFAVSIGLVVDGKPVLGVVHNPATGETDAAVSVGQCAETRRPVPSSLDVLVSRNEARWRDIPPLPPGSRVFGLGSVAYRLALLARGKADALVTAYGRSEWDVAAGVALCEAAGIRATDVLGETIPFNQPEPFVRGLLAGAPAVHDAMMEHFRRSGVVGA